MAEFLLEIGLEEVPARMIAGAQAELTRRVVALLARERLLPEGTTEADAAAVRGFSTARRLAVWVREVLPAQPDMTEEVVGPAVKIAFKDGVATPAAEAFARKNGVTVGGLKTIATPKGEYLAVSTVKPGRSAGEVLLSELPKEIGAIYWAKNMYWRPGKPERFVRPVMWLACLLGDAVVPFSFGGKTAGRASVGHRVLSSGEPFELVVPASYEAQLEGEFVLADVEARRHKIRKALDHVTRTVPGARWREDEPLVDQVTHLTEWPDVLLGTFDAVFLALPEEVLVTVMRDHQKYFAVEGPDGRLLPYFLAVTNLSLTDANAPTIRQGNERVLKARFNDARFFWEFDQRTPIVARVALLENVTFQRDLGSYALKSERVGALAAKLVSLADEAGVTVDGTAVAEAARLAKTDLTTEMVKEFTELQGQIGGLYAAAQGASAVVAEAIYDQYTPAGMGDGIPRSFEGQTLGIADRADTIGGLFGLGMEPTGSKDPFALRRAANGIVKILAEGGLPLSLSRLAELVAKDEPTAARIRLFFAERLEFYLREVEGAAYDTVTAVLVSGRDDVRDAVERARAVTAMRGSADFLAVSAAFKRMKNILLQADEKGELPDGSSFGDAGATVDPAQAALATRAAEVSATVAGLRARSEYVAALEAMATLRPEVDRFFEAVMVMDPDPAVRAGRLGLLAAIVRGFGGIADFSEIVSG